MKSMLIVVIIVGFAFLFLKHQEQIKSDEIARDTVLWHRKFAEFSDCLKEYNYNNLGNPSRDIIDGSGKLFPDDFGILANYGIKNRKHLVKSSDFKSFQDEITIIVKDLSYFEKRHVEPDSMTANSTVIAYKDIFLEKNRCRRIYLYFDGSVAQLPVHHSETQ